MLEELFNIEAEQQLLGSVLLSSGCVGAVSAVNASDFSVAEHCEIFAWMQREIDEGRNPTGLAIRPILAKMRVGPVSGTEYLTRLARAAHPPTIREAVAQVKGFAARRLMDGLGEELRSQARNPEVRPHEIALDAIGALNDVMSIARKPSPAAQSVFDIACNLLDTLSDPDDGSFVSTGIRTLDNFMGGWPRGEISIVAGRPSMGKSAILMAIARRAAHKGINIMLFSKEMPRRVVSARMLSDLCYDRNPSLQVPYADIIRKKLGSFQKQRLAAHLDRLRDCPVHIDDQRGLTAAEIHMRALRYADKLDKKGKRLDMVMVDHLGKVRPSDRYKGNMVAETGEKSDAFMTMSAELNVAAVLAHQLNRNTEGREDKRPQPADLRDSGNLEQDTNTLLFPYRPLYYLEKQKSDDQGKEMVRLDLLESKRNILEAIVSKCRNGACGTVDLFVDMPSNHIEDLSYG